MQKIIELVNLHVHEFTEAVQLGSPLSLTSLMSW